MRMQAMALELDWRLLGVGAAAAGIACLYAGYKLGRRAAVPKLYQGPAKSYEITNNPLARYVSAHNAEDAVLARLRAFSISHKYGQMTSPIDEGKLLTMLVRALNAKKVIDVGVFTGCSAFAMALGLAEGGKVLACDISEEFTSLGRPYWVEGGVADKIDLRLQPAVKTLRELLDQGEAGSFDLVFIDADKQHYGDYFDLAMQLLRIGGLVVVDNALWHGKVADPAEQDLDTCAIRSLNTAMASSARVDFVLLNLADGIGIGQKMA